MTEERKEPKLRFPGFAGPWGRCKLDDLANLYQPTTISSEQCNENGIYPVFGANGIIGRYDKKNHDTDQVCVSCRGAKCGTVNYVSAPVWITGNSMVCNIDSNTAIDKCYFYYAMSNLDYLPIITGGAQPQITREKLRTIMVSFPSHKEQIKIGKYLKKLDDLIALHQHRYEDVKTFKKAMLQKMFPKDGETVPEIRFPGFEDEWKQYAMGDIFSERNEKGDESLQILSVSIHSGVSESELDEEKLGKHVKRSEDKSTYKHVYTGDLVFNMMRAWQGAIGAVKTEGMVSPAYISAKPAINIDIAFLDNMVKRPQFVEQLNTLSYGVTDFRKRLYWDSFIKVTCMMPSIEEQIKIGTFFEKLDMLESKLLDKCNELRKMKKSMLQQMLL